MSQQGNEATGAPSGPEAPLPAPDEPALRPRRLGGAELLQRVFGELALKAGDRAEARRWFEAAANAKPNWNAPRKALSRLGD